MPKKKCIKTSQKRCSVCRNKHEQENKRFMYLKNHSLFKLEYKVIQIRCFCIPWYIDMPRGCIVHVPSRGAGNHAWFFFTLATDNVAVAALVDVRVSPDLVADRTLGDELKRRGGRYVFCKAVYVLVVV